MKAAKDTVPAPVTQLAECLLGHSLLGWTGSLLASTHLRLSLNIHYLRLLHGAYVI